MGHASIAGCRAVAKSARVPLELASALEEQLEQPAVRLQLQPPPPPMDICANKGTQEQQPHGDGGRGRAHRRYVLVAAAQHRPGAGGGKAARRCVMPTHTARTYRGGAHGLRAAAAAQAKAVTGTVATTACPAKPTTSRQHTRTHVSQPSHHAATPLPHRPSPGCTYIARLRKQQRQQYTGRIPCQR